jgi:hypothetical protein
VSEEAASSGSDIALEVAGQKINVKNVKSLNTILTLIAAGAACFAVYLLTQHQVEAKEGGKELAGALKEVAQAAREQTCIMRFKQEDRQQNADFCKQIAR